MMRKIGFDGGHSIYELGPAPDVVLFFECVKTYVVKACPEQDWHLLTDRLYRRYLRREELDRALVLMYRVQNIFAQLPAQTTVEWDQAMLENSEKSWLKPDQSSLADVFITYFSHFASACRSAESFAVAFNIYQPVRVVISDLAGFARDKNKPLAEYDALEDGPFWLR